MFFPAFNGGVGSPLPKETIFAVEYLTSQILVNAEATFLEETLSRGNFIDALLQELEFFGQLRKDDLPEVREYLTNQKSALEDTAKKILSDPDNPNSRRYWLSHYPFQTI